MTYREFDGIDCERWPISAVWIIGFFVFPIVILNLFVPANEGLIPVGVIGFAALWLWIWYLGATRFENWQEARKERKRLEAIQKPESK